MQTEDSPMRKLAFMASVALLISGIIYYVVWSLVFNTWDLTNVDHLGVYAVTIVLCGFGVTGILLYSKKP